MKIEEASFILDQVSLAHPCINGYTCITGEQIDEAVDVYNTEIMKRESIIQQLKSEIKRLKRKDRIDTVIKYDRKMKNYLKNARNQLAAN